MKKKIVLGIMLTCLLGIPLTAENSKEYDIEVIVTASRVKEEATEAASYVTVITAEQLSGAGQSTLVEVLENLAGVHFRSSSGNAAQAEVSMRGFGENSHGRVLILLDGRRLNRPDMASINWLEIPIENIERVEVVRGGGSVLYGDNAVAGVINIITKRGSPGLDIEVSGQYGSYNSNQERVEVSGAAGAVSLSATAEHSATDGYRDRSAYRSLAFTTSLGLELETLSSSLALSYNKLFYELPGALTKAEFDADPTQAQPLHTDDQAESQYLNADLGLSYSPGASWMLDGNLSYGLKFIQSDIVSWFSYSDLLLHSFAVTPKLKLDLDVLSGNRLVAGIDGYLDILGLTTYPDVERTSTTVEAQLTKATLGFYATDALSLLSFLTVNAGLRYEIARIGAVTVKTPATPIDEAQLLQSLVYNAGVLFAPSPGSKLWAKFGSVFRYPFTDEIVDLYGFLAQPFNTSLRPEQGYQLDVGAETLLSGLLKLAASGYWLDMQDEIAYDSLTKLNVNLDKTRRLGAEAEIGLRVPSWLELSGSYTYTLAVFKEGTYANKRIPLVPAHQASGKATLLLPFGFSLGASGDYVGEQYFGSDPDNAQGVLPAYFLLGAFVSYKPSYVPGKLEVFFGVDNILYTRYATTGFYGFNLATSGYEVFYYPGPGRSWKLGASYRY